MSSGIDCFTRSPSHPSSPDLAWMLNCACESTRLLNHEPQYVFVNLYFPSAGYFETEIHFCIKEQMMETRRMYGESCPVFCPTHYRPVCGASKMRSYNYRAFTNGCQLDMVNCRGDDDENGTT